MEWREYFRVLHWGPLLALAIITEITLSGLYCLLQWYPPSQPGGLIHLIIYLQWDVFILYNFFNAIYIGPGHVPKGWKPADKKDEKCLQYCSQCESFKAPRSHHCRKCKRCVMKMDHHCPWINNCVGHRNHHSFTLFVFFAPLGCLHAVCVLIPSMYRAINLHYYLSLGIRTVPLVRLTPTSFIAALFGVSLGVGVAIAVGILCFIQRYYLLYGTGEEPLVHLSMEMFLLGFFAVGLGIGVMFAVGALCLIQIKSIIRNETGIESWIRDKAEYRDRGEDEEEEFTYPYDLGRWPNFRMVCHVRRRPELNGLWWPVIPECDQYTLTREQILQKREKQDRTVVYNVVRSYAGSFLPISMGPRVCCCPPCTDEPRVAIKEGERMRVTRWKKHWLYGDKILSDSELKGKNRERGWFPRKCVVEPFEHAHEQNCDKAEAETSNSVIGSNGDSNHVTHQQREQNETRTRDASSRNHEKTE